MEKISNAAARRAAAAVGSMGVALGACIVPAAGTPGFTLAEDETEHRPDALDPATLAAANARIQRVNDPGNES